MMGSLRGINGALLPYGDATEVLRVEPFQFQSLQIAIDAAVAGAVIEVSPGTYEAFTVPFSKTGLRIVGVGSFCDVKIAPASGRAAEIAANNVEVSNIDFIGAGDGAVEAVLVSGDQFHSFGCRYEAADNSGIGLHFKSVYADFTAVPPVGGSGSIARLEGNEFCWLATGICFTNADGLGSTQDYIAHNIFRNITGDEVLSVGDSSLKNLMLINNIFEAQEDGTAPTTFLDIDNTGNTGLVADNVFAYATNEADVIKLAVGVLFVANLTEAGISTARPS